MEEKQAMATQDGVGSFTVATEPAGGGWGGWGQVRSWVFFTTGAQSQWVCV